MILPISGLIYSCKVDQICGPVKGYVGLRFITLDRGHHGEDATRTARRGLELPVVRGNLRPPLAAVRRRFRNARGTFPPQVGSRAGPFRRTRGSVAGRCRRRLLGSAVLGFADSTTLPPSQRA